MKKWGALLAGLVLLSVILGGCSLIRIEEEERKPLEYTVVKQEDIPEEAAELIERKKKQEFQMTYQVGEELYLIRGYGQQMTGGYSIQAEEVSASSNAVFFRTKLLGPSESQVGSEPSYPYIVVKIRYTDMPVVFL